MSTLILHLSLAPPGPHTEYRYTLTADGHSASGHASARAALLPAPGRAAGETVAVVPARALSWQRVQLPQGVGRQSPRLRAVLEGLLEERLLDDPAQLHFALPPDARPGSAVWVAICDRAWLRASLQALEMAGHPVARVVPEFAPGATASGQPELFAQGTPEDAQWVVTGYGVHGGVAVLPLSGAALALVGVTADADHAAAVHAAPAVAALAEKVWGHPVQLETDSTRALRAAHGHWDLAQFDLASSGRIRALRQVGALTSALLHAPQWRAARWGLAVLLLAHLLGLNLWAWQERQSLATKQASVRSALTQTFPQVKVVVDAPVQMERELALLRQAAGALSARDLEPLLATSASALPATWQASAIDYSGGSLRLRGPALSAAEQSHASDTARASGYQLHTEGDTVQVRAATTP
ncbi:type II secretion system protein GspL [Simplicispira psychrophila]|uniref:type II secretion system protein GspL n=1 Tax=Simplicispira psychrophila TaxID=80882 RepID=UPI000485BEF8|nr:type II secretion system protein GspL [Simplicispira psychrophila]